MACKVVSASTPDAGIPADSEVADELHLLEAEGEDVEGEEADAWASEAEPEAEMTASGDRSMRVSNKDIVEPSQTSTDLPPAQRPPPARRK